MGVIVGIDKLFMSECRALANFTGNTVATLSGQKPIDELSLEPDVHDASTNAPETGVVS